MKNNQPNLLDMFKKLDDSKKKEVVESFNSFEKEIAEYEERNRDTAEALHEFNKKLSEQKTKK